MQQYFVDTLLKQGDTYVFTKEQAHHLRDVLRMDHETLRLVDKEKAWFAECMNEGKQFVAIVKEEDTRNVELPFEVTLIMALIRKEKFELILQKAAELGVSRIVPFESSRCIVHMRKEKSAKIAERYESILQSASEQCKRSRIPSIAEVKDFREILNEKSEINLAAYENAGSETNKISDYPHGRSVSIVIGPEGGFSKEEVAQLAQAGFDPITLGPRILRAETAAFYALSVIAEGAL